MTEQKIDHNQKAQHGDFEPAHALKDTDWPYCYRRCAAVRRLGVDECESVCPWRFDEDGTTKLPERA